MSRYKIVKNESQKRFDITIGGCGCCSSSVAFPSEVEKFTDDDARYWYQGFVTEGQISDARNYLTNQLKLLDELETEFKKVTPEQMAKWERLYNE